MKTKLITSFIISILFFASCKPKLTQEITINIIPQKELGSNYSQADFDKDAENTLHAIISRLNRIGAYYGNEQITQLDNTKHIYSIGFPEKAETEAIGRIITNPGNLEFWETEEFHTYSDFFEILHDSLTLKNIYWKTGFDNCYLTFNAKDTANINKTLSSLETVQPKELTLKWSINPEFDTKDFYSLYILKKDHTNNPAMNGDCIVEVQARPSNTNDVWEVWLEMDSNGAYRWAKLTEKNIGNTLAMVLNNKVYSAPRVNMRIEGGRSTISGNFTQLEAEEMAAILSGGQLPLKVRISKENK